MAGRHHGSIHLSERQGSLMLLFCAFIWGSTFVAQSVGMDYIGPFTFQAARSILGSLVLLPFILRGRQKNKPRSGEFKNLLWGGVLCGLALFVAVNLQQKGLTETSPGKAGFLSALYIIIVPVLGVLRGRHPRPALWISVAIATIGLYLLSVQEGFTVATGDAYIILSALVFSLHILIVDHFSIKVSALELCSLQFFICGVLSSAAAFLFEKPELKPLLSCAIPILYAGVLSSGVAYTLQIVGQRLVSPPVASLIMSLESVFAVISGMVVLGQIPSLREFVGCILMFAAILISQRADQPREIA